jgi:hypothetical protein
MPENATTEAVATGKQKGRRSYSRHGLTSLKARVMVRGLASIDLRTSAAQALLTWKKQLLIDLGGEENLSAQRQALIDLAVRTRLFVDHLDSYLLAQESLVNKRKKALIPALRERQVLTDSLARILSLLGLDRVAKPMPSLQEYISATKESHQ